MQRHDANDMDPSSSAEKGCLASSAEKGCLDPDTYRELRLKSLVSAEEVSGLMG